MPKGLVNESSLNSIGSAINVLNGTEGTYLPSEMGEAIIDVIPTETASGNPINITDAAAYPAKSVVTTLEPVQDLHGYDKPWSGGSGKNLCPPLSNWSVGFIKLDGTIGDEESYRHNKYSPFIKIEGTASIVFSFENGFPQTGTDVSYKAWRGMAFYDANKDFISRSSQTDYGTTEIIENSIPQNAVYIIVFCRTFSTTDEPMVELGSTATTYEPYSNICPITGHTGVELKHSGADTSDYETHSVTFPQAQSPVYGCEVDWVNGVLRVTEANVDLGTLNWHLVEGTGFYADDNIGAAKVTGVTMKSSCYKSVNNVSSISGIRETNAVAGSSVSSNNRVYITDLSYESVSDFKQAMSGIPLVYKLATPLEIPITPEIITLLKGENNIWTDAGTSEIEYKVDLQTYIQKLINEASTNASALSVSPLSLGKSAVLTSTDGEDADEIEEVDEPVLYDKVKVSDDVESVDEKSEEAEELPVEEDTEAEPTEKEPDTLEKEGGDTV